MGTNAPSLKSDAILVENVKINEIGRKYLQSLYLIKDIYVEYICIYAYV